MVYFVRSAKVIAKKGKEAIDWAYKVADYVKDKSGSEVEVLMNVTGPQNVVYWMARDESVGDFEKVFFHLCNQFFANVYDIFRALMI